MTGCQKRKKKNQGGTAFSFTEYLNGCLISSETEKWTKQKDTVKEFGCKKNSLPYV